MNWYALALTVLLSLAGQCRAQNTLVDRTVSTQQPNVSEASPMVLTGTAEKSERPATVVDRTVSTHQGAVIDIEENTQ